jgi:hypothetical protein
MCAAPVVDVVYFADAAPTRIFEFFYGESKADRNDFLYILRCASSKSAHENPRHIHLVSTRRHDLQA